MRKSRRYKNKSVVDLHYDWNKELGQFFRLHYLLYWLRLKFKQYESYSSKHFERRSVMEKSVDIFFCIVHFQFPIYLFTLYTDLFISILNHKIKTNYTQHTSVLVLSDLMEVLKHLECHIHYTTLSLQPVTTLNLLAGKNQSLKNIDFLYSNYIPRFVFVHLCTTFWKIMKKINSFC